MTKKIIVNPDKCIGCNTCCLIDGDTFELNLNEYKAIVKKQPDQISDKTKSAIDACPVGAISIIDEA